MALLIKFRYQKPRFVITDVPYAVVAVTADVDGDFVDVADNNTNEFSLFYTDYSHAKP